MSKKSKFILITGGARSGKSTHALKMCEDNNQKKLYIATCPKIDNETDKRIINHQNERKNKNWDTIEETLNIEDIFISNKHYPIILLDCLTLWINNYLFKYFDDKSTCNIENDFYLMCKRTLIAINSLENKVIIVTNEVGSGIVPNNPLSRVFRDISGKANQLFAEYADEVILMSCGIPLKIK